MALLSTRPTGLLIAVIGIFLIAAATYFATTAAITEASHPHLNRTASIENGPGSGLDEKYCARVLGTTSHSTALSAIATALTGGGSGDYHGLNGSKVSFVQDPVQCAGAHIRVGHSIRYHFSAVWKGVTCGGNNCAQASGPFGSHNGHRDYNSYDIFIRDASVSSHTINHETGHALGLNDGDGTCPGSIMHSGSYGCTGFFPSFPTTADRIRVTFNSQGF